MKLNLSVVYTEQLETYESISMSNTCICIILDKHVGAHVMREQ